MHRPNRETPADAYTATNDPRHADGSFPGHRLGSIQISCRHLGQHDLGVNPNLIASFSPPEACFFALPVRSPPGHRSLLRPGLGRAEYLGAAYRLSDTRRHPPMTLVARLEG
ncbi:hypothetical protein MRX96_054868 [Rhipicephalus microplus]